MEPQPRRRRKGGRKGQKKPFEDRYYGRFHCKICNRMWESSRVFTVAGTKIVKYKQGCQRCDNEDAWYFPYALEILRCSICQVSPCECECEDCGGLIHLRYWENPDKNGRQEADPQYDYCECVKDKDWHVGDKIDQKKPHLSKLCGKCRSGRPCNRGDVLVIDFDDEN